VLLKLSHQEFSRQAKDSSELCHRLLFVAEEFLSNDERNVFEVIRNPILFEVKVEI